ncbi:MAG: hypothetical protein CSA97_03650 [Bacteroidetes bacterium]|nr:MAG: hypothetical protein CSA97_03650 [Bacteroidota bacterium]
MEIKTQQSSCVLTMEVCVAVSDYKAQYEKTLKDTLKNVTINGFRKGKVPRKRIESQYGMGIRIDVVSKALDSAVGEYLQENKILSFTRLMATDDSPVCDYNEETDFTFKVELGVAPEYTLNREMAVEVVHLVPDDEYLDKYIHGMRESQATAEPVDVVADDTTVVFEAMPLSVDGEDLPQGFVQRMLPMDAEEQSVVLPEKVATLKGMKSGEEVAVCKFADFFNTEHEPEIEDVELKTIREERDYRIKIERVEKRILPELDESFFRSVLNKPEDDSSSMEELKEEVRTTAERQLNIDVRKVEDMKLNEKLVKDWDFDIPEDFLKRLVDSLELEEEERANVDMESERYGLRQSCLEMRLQGEMEELKAEVEPDAINEVIEGMAVDYLQSMGLGQLAHSDEARNWFRQRLMTDNEFSEQMRPMLNRRIIMRWVETQLPVEYVDMDASKFFEESKDGVVELVNFPEGKAKRKTAKKSTASAKKADVEAKGADAEKATPKKRTTRTKKSDEASAEAKPKRRTTKKADEVAEGEEAAAPKKRATRKKKEE